MIALRPGAPEDHPLIFSSWLHSYARSVWARRFPREMYYALHRILIERLVERGSVLIAASEDDGRTILGWSCTGPGNVVHYVFVKPRARGCGIAKALLAPFLGRGEVVTSHAQEFYSPHAGAWRWRIPEGWRFDDRALVLPVEMLSR